MPLRPCVSLTSIASCLIRPPRPLLFHTTTARPTDNTNFYETLGLQSTASPAEIKKQFYTLSKAHHPDRNPNDLEASSRFVKISEAYAILGNPQKRERYDRDSQRAGGQATPSSSPRGSHSSSSSGPYGSRPASGLSRRRTKFRGPPPSFYRSGGWGAQGTKRQTQAEAASSSSSSANADAASPRAGSNAGEGFGPGGAQAGYDVPHFDREGHFRTQESQEQRRRRRMEEAESYDYGSGGSMLINFIFVGGVVSFACLLPAMFEKGRHGRKARDDI